MNKETAWIFAGIVLFLFVMSLFFGNNMGMMAGNNFCSNIGGLWCYSPMSYFGGLINILFIIAIVLLIVWVVQQRSNRK